MSYYNCAYVVQYTNRGNPAPVAIYSSLTTASHGIADFLRNSLPSEDEAKAEVILQQWQESGGAESLAVKAQQGELSKWLYCSPALAVK